ncbi:MAG: hypothetical protein KGL35_25375 [Bradyrhizobium sp.]|nr:hypothetical protein [Bradyrhizobium sp.]
MIVPLAFILIGFAVASLGARWLGNATSPPAAFAGAVVVVIGIVIAVLTAVAWFVLAID